MTRDFVFLRPLGLRLYARVTKAWRTGVAPAVDLNGWGYNDYKTAIAKGMSDDEFEILKAQIKRAQRSSLPQWKKDVYYEAYEFIREVRENAGA